LVWAFIPALAAEAMVVLAVAILAAANWNGGQTEDALLAAGCCSS